MLKRGWWHVMVLGAVVVFVSGCSAGGAGGGDPLGGEMVDDGSQQNANGNDQAPDDSVGNEPSDVVDADDPGMEQPVMDDPSTDDPSDTPGGDPDAPPEPSASAVVDFAVSDVNPESARFQEPVSPRDYLGQISAWYFGHST